jgi:hypothetical protein
MDQVGNTTNRHLWLTIQPLLPQIVDALEAGEMLIEVKRLTVLK